MGIPLMRGIGLPEMADFPSFPDWFQYFDDFNNENCLTRYTFVVSGHAAPSALADEEFGVMTFNSGANATDNAYTQMQMDDANVILRANKQYGFLTRVQMSEATDSDVYAGLCVIDGAGGPTAGYQYGVFLRKDDGDTNWDLVVARNASTFPDDYSQTLGIAQANTDWTDLAILITTGATDGYGTVQAYVNGSPVGGLIEYQGGLCTFGQALAPTVALQNGSATARTLKVDGIGYQVQR